MLVTLNDNEWELENYRENDFIKEMMDISGGILDLSKFSRITTRGFDNYLKFLNFEMDEGIEKTFEFLGYPNENKYPLDYWKCKLHDNRVREKFYSMGLGNIDPLF